MTTRRSLTAIEEQYVEVWFKGINKNNLQPRFAQMVESIQEQYEEDKKLSEAQLDVLRNSKYVSDSVNRSKAIRRGKLESNYDIQYKLNRVYNPV